VDHAEYNPVALALTVSRFGKLDEIPGWDTVAAIGGFYGGTTWLRFHEVPAGWGGELPKNLETIYVVLRDGSETIAVAPCYVANGPGALPSLTDIWRQYPAGESQGYPMVHCGPPRGYAGRLLLRKDLDPAARKAAVSALVAEVKGIAAEHDAKSIAFGHLPSDEARELLACEPAMAPLFTHDDCSLAVPASFDAYLQSMRHKQRDNAKLSIRHFEEAGFRLERRPLAGILDGAVPLIGGHERKYGGGVDDAFVRSYVSGCLGRFDERTFCMLKDDRLFGLFVSFYQSGVYYARMMGIDEPAIPKRAAAYTNLLFFEIREAIREGVTEIHYGRESLEAKVRYGCTVTPRWTVAGSPSGFTAELRKSLATEVRRLLAEDERVLRGHTLPQLPPEAIDRLIADGEALVSGHVERAGA
jgi:hypothetical protein